jgi:hypothetical protein
MQTSAFHRTNLLKPVLEISSLVSCVDCIVTVFGLLSTVLGQFLRVSDIVINSDPLGVSMEEDWWQSVFAGERGVQKMLFMKSILDGSQPEVVNGARLRQIIK